MGTAFPLLVYSREKTKGQVSVKAPGLFYGWDTAGAVAGALATGFILIPVVGMRKTMLIGTMLSFLAAGLAVGMHWLFNIVAPNGDRLFRRPISFFGDRKLKLLLLILVLSGLASLGYELIWTRILILIVGSSTYAFTITVSVFILGTALGSLLMSNKLSQLRSIYEVFVHIQIGIGLTVYVTLLLYGKLPVIFMSLMNGYNHLFWDYIVQFILAGLIMISPTLLIGASFPLAVALIEEHGVPQDHSFALSFASISMGNVLGVILTALLIIPDWGLQKGTVVLIGVNGLAAILLTMSFRGIRGRKMIVGGVTGLFIMGLLLMPGWNRVTMTSGVYARLPVYKKLAGSESNFKNLIKLYRLKYYRESIEDVVSVVQMPTLGEQPYYALAVDGKVDASTGTEDMKTQTLSGHLPFIFGRNIEKTLVIGLASGITSAAVALHPVSHIKTVEIEPAMKQAARVFKNFNNNILNNKRMNVVIDDGRHYLNVKAESWDLIVSEPSNPWMSGPSRLFTLEFYQLVKKRLNTGGLFVQWVPLYGMGTPYFKSLVRTFLTVFPHTAAFQVSKGDILLIGSLNTLKISASRLKQLFENKRIRNSLERADIYQPGEILARWLGSASILKTISKKARLNTDNNGYVEFGSPRFLYRNTISKNLALFQKDTLATHNLFRHIVWNLKDRSSRNDLLLSLAEMALKQNHEKVTATVKQYFKQEGNKLYQQYLSAVLADHKGEVRQAARHYENVITLDPNFKETCWKLIQLYISNGRIQRAFQLFTHIRPFCSHNRLAYWRGVANLIEKRPGKAVNLFSNVSAAELPEYKMDLPLYAYIASDQIGDSLKALRYKALLKKSLVTLRQKAEQDQSLQQIHELLNTVERARRHWLPESESQKIDKLLERELLLPLQHYNHGINAMLTGRLQEARASFQKVKSMLPPEYPSTRATYFLALLDSIKEGHP